jgi:hypothetical protein
VKLVMTIPRALVFLSLLSLTATAQASAIDVGLIGDETVASLAARLDAAAPGSWHFVQGADAVARSKPALVLYVVNSVYGPQRVHRDAVNVLAKAKLTRLVIVFTETSKMHDPELLELEIKENVEVLNTAGIAGTPPVAVDLESFRADPKLKVIKGVQGLSEYMRQQAATARNP